MADKLITKKFQSFKGERSDSPKEKNRSYFKTYKNLDVTPSGEDGGSNAVSCEGMELLTSRPLQENPDGGATTTPNSMSILVSKFPSMKGNLISVMSNGDGSANSKTLAVGRQGLVRSLYQELWEQPDISILSRDVEEATEPPASITDWLLSSTSPEDGLHYVSSTDLTQSLVDDNDGPYWTFGPDWNGDRFVAKLVTSTTYSFHYYDGTTFTTIGTSSRATTSPSFATTTPMHSVQRPTVDGGVYVVAHHGNPDYANHLYLIETTGITYLTGAGGIARGATDWTAWDTSFHQTWCGLSVSLDGDLVALTAKNSAPRNIYILKFSREEGNVVLRANFPADTGIVSTTSQPKPQLQLGPSGYHYFLANVSDEFIVYKCEISSSGVANVSAVVNINTETSISYIYQCAFCVDSDGDIFAVLTDGDTYAGKALLYDVSEATATVVDCDIADDDFGRQGSLIAFPIEGGFVAGGEQVTPELGAIAKFTKSDFANFTTEVYDDIENSAFSSGETSSSNTSGQPAFRDQAGYNLANLLSSQVTWT